MKEDYNKYIEYMKDWLNSNKKGYGYYERSVDPYKDPGNDLLETWKELLKKQEHSTELYNYYTFMIYLDKKSYEITEKFDKIITVNTLRLNEIIFADEYNTYIISYTYELPTTLKM